MVLMDGQSWHQETQQSLFLLSSPAVTDLCFFDSRAHARFVSKNRLNRHSKKFDERFDEKLTTVQRVNMRLGGGETP